MAFQKAVIVYCSPGGSTRQVAQVIGKVLEEAGKPVSFVDLGRRDEASSGVEKVIEALNGQETVLFVGSPVYVNRPVPPVMTFLSQLPENVRGCAVPFVTWGGVSSGIALYDMAKALTESGYTLVAAAKVVALHSMMRGCENPIGDGHPDEDDERSIRELVAAVLKKATAERPEAVSLSELAYQSQAVHEEMEKVTLEMAKRHLPEKQLAEDRCTECGICEEICPVGAITLSPYPQFDETCICCFECARNCPEAAILADLSALEDRIRGRAKQFNESPLTKVWR